MDNVKQFIPPANVAENAQRALKVRASKPQSQRGMTLVGLARANQLANRRPVSADTIRRMVAYFDRHEVDKDGETWNEKGKGWQAWYGWGGDEGRTWAQQMLRQIEQETKQMDKRLMVEMVDGQFMIYEADNLEDAVVEENLQDFLDTLSRMFGFSRDETEQAVDEVVDTIDDSATNPSESGNGNGNGNHGGGGNTASTTDDEKVDLTAEQRDALPDDDFAIPQTRNFPVASPEDIADAVSSWGRYEGDVSFETFKRNLIAIARRKGEEFVAMLPQAWKDEMEEATKAVARAILNRMA